MSYRYEKEQGGGRAIVFDGIEKGISSSPYLGMANCRNINTSYYPGVGYVNYKRQLSPLSTSSLFYAGIHSVNVSNNLGWTFAAPGGSVSMGNPLHKATSPKGINYILDDTGQVWKQTGVNASTFAALGNVGRFGNGHGGLAYWNNYLVVFGDGFIEFCGDGTGDSTIVSGNWNIRSGTGNNVFLVTASTSPSQLTFLLPTGFGTTSISVGDPVTFTSTGTLPAPLVVGTTYYVTSVAGNIYQVSLTTGGGNITFTSAGTGVISVTDILGLLPIGNITNFSFFGLTPGNSTLTIAQYTSPTGATVVSNWLSPTGQYAIIDPTGNIILGNFTYKSATVTLVAPLSSNLVLGNYSVQILNTLTSNYRAYVSKLDGNLYFANGRYLGAIVSFNSNTTFNPGSPSTYTVDFGITVVPQPQDSITDMVDLNSNMVISGNFDIYSWDYLSANVQTSNPVGEQIVRMINLLNNIYILAGTKGNVYVSNGFSAQVFYKIPDYVSSSIDPVWNYGDLMVHRAKLFFQAMATTSSGTNVLAGVFSIIASPSTIGENATGFVMESQNSYGLTPSAGAKPTGVLIDNEAFSTGLDMYYSGWSNGASAGGIDFNDGTGWSNFEPVIESDLIPVGDLVGDQKHTFGNIEFKLDRPMLSGDQIRLSWRPSLTDSYSVIGTTATTVLSEYKQSNIAQAQWIQFKAELACGTPTSFIPLREVRLHLS